MKPISRTSYMKMAISILIIVIITNFILFHFKNNTEPDADFQSKVNRDFDVQVEVGVLRKDIASLDATVASLLQKSSASTLTSEHDQVQVNLLRKDITHGGTTSDTTEYLWNGKQIYIDAARALQPITDKVTGHTYQVMYGMFLLPYYHLNPTMKMLEIGLGCDMIYGPGASVAIYQKLFPKAELWEAEYDEKCVEKNRDGLLKGINILTGDQGNDTVLDEWILTSGGGFDIVIDDGGHHNCQIWHSFKKLWPTIKPGGLYFIEDMQVAKNENYRRFTTNECNGDLLVPEKLKDFMDELIYDITRKSDIEFIFCQSEACVLGKKNNITTDS